GAGVSGDDPSGDQSRAGELCARGAGYPGCGEPPVRRGRGGVHVRSGEQARAGVHLREWSDGMAFYGIGGQRLATMSCAWQTHGVNPNWYDTFDCPLAYDVYWGGKRVKSKGLVVATDRLGSVRATL